MESKIISSGVKISVTPVFRSDLSHPFELSYFFNYTVHLTNQNNFSIQLISRDWYIFDSLGEAKYVNGVGVIGKQPILNPGETFVYTSGCDLLSELGFMKGFYTFKNLEDSSYFESTIPTFKLEFPARLN